MHDPKVEVTATGAVSFQSDFQGSPKMYASYATFHPGKKGSLDRAVDWLTDAYVHRLYKGKVVTDFDEVTRRFPDGTFTLSKIVFRLVSQICRSRGRVGPPLCG